MVGWVVAKRASSAIGAKTDADDLRQRFEQENKHENSVGVVKKPLRIRAITREVVLYPCRDECQNRGNHEHGHKGNCAGDMSRIHKSKVCAHHRHPSKRS